MSINRFREMKKSTILLFSLFNSYILSAQNYNIEWEKDRELAYSNGQKMMIPFFKNKDQFSLNEFYQPEFTTTLNQNLDYVDINVVDETLLNTNDLLNLNFQNLISDKINYSIQNTRNNTTLKLVPYYKKNNQYYRINQFNLVEKNNISKQNRSVRNLNRESVLKTGRWYKIKVKKTGVFKLSKDFFTKNGIPTSGYDLSKLKIYGNGSGRLMENLNEFRYDNLQEIPIDFRGSSDNSFDNNDYVLFYAKGPHQFYRNSNTTLADTFLRFNTYDDYSYYFITLDGNNGKRIEKRDFSGVPTQIYNEVDQYDFHKIDSININQMGRTWVGNPLNSGTSFTKNLNSNPLSLGQKSFLKYSVVGKNATNTRFDISVNNSLVSSNNFNPSQLNILFEERKGQLEIQNSQANFSLDVKYNNNSNPSGLAFINYLELKYKQPLNYSNNQFSFRIFNNLNNNVLHGFNLSNSSDVNVWNVSDISDVFQINLRNSIAPFQSNNPIFQNEFVAFKDDHSYTEVEYSGVVTNQDIRSFTDINLVIVVHPSLKQEAVRLANFRERYNQIKVAVVTTDEIYNEFSSGSKDPIAIRDYFKFLKDSGNPLEYAILFGSTTYDPKNRISNKSNFIPSFYSLNSTEIDYTSTTDDYFAMLSVDRIANEFGNGEYLYSAAGIDIAIGRLAASNISEAREMVDKIISYYEKLPNRANTFGDWRTNIVAVSDDPEYKPYYDPNNSNLDDLVLDVNTPKYDKFIDATFLSNENKIYTVNKQYIDSYTPEQTSAGLRYPIVNRNIINSIERGSNFLIYYGHGGPRSWAQERIITGEELEGLRNFTNTISRVPIVATITCDFTTWDLPQYNSAGEMLLKNSNGGALSMITTNRPISTTFGEEFNGKLLNELFYKVGNQNQTTGKALVNVKKTYSPNSSEHAKVSLLGDPMVEVARPRQQIKINNFKVNNVDVDINTYQVKALDFIEIDGEVMQNNNSTDTQFNGKLQGLLFEKPYVNSLKDNKNFIKPNYYQFTEEYKTIFKATTSVEKGKFNLKTYLPKDINYEVDFRKLTLYAHTDNNDAASTDKIKLGGLNENGLNDNQPPQGKLYLNNIHFANGGISNPKPHLIACLTDDFGINSSGYSIGHDIVATIDGKVQESVVLNEYFTSGDGDQCVNKSLQDYQKGQVSFQLNNLELGQHTIELKFWDINNNSNTASLDFVVMEDGDNKLKINKLLNWPNPFTNNTFFHFEHNCDSDLEVMVQIFTVAGRIVKTIRQTVSAEPFREGFRTGKYAIEWDGLDDFGDKIGKGTYIYKVNVKGISSNTCNGSASAVERLVILK